MKKLITLSLCIGVYIFGVWISNTSINDDKITSSELKNDPIAIMLNEQIKEKNQYKRVKLLEAKRKEELQKTNDNKIKHIQSKKVSRGEELQLIPMKVIATAYCPYQDFNGLNCDGTPDTTATGTRPKYGTIAADPKELNFGTKVLIPNYNSNKICTIEDTGSALRKDKHNIRIDLYMDTYEEAMNFGKQEIIIYIVK